MSTHRDVGTVKLPLHQPDPLALPAGLRDLQSRSPVHPVITAVGDPAWLVIGRAEARAWMDDERLGRSHPDPAHAARTGESMLFGGPSGAFDTGRPTTRGCGLCYSRISPRLGCEPCDHGSSS
jgi:hypothetical protein